MKASEIRELKDNEIQERIEAEKAALFKMKLSHTISPLDDTSKFIWSILELSTRAHGFWG